MQKPDNHWLEELLKKEAEQAALPDNGFYERVMQAIPTWWKNLLRRMFIQSAAFILGLLGFVVSGSLKVPTADSEKWQEAATHAQEVWGAVPQYMECFSDTNLLTIVDILAVAFIFTFTLADLPGASKKVV